MAGERRTLERHGCLGDFVIRKISVYFRRSLDIDPPVEDETRLCFPANFEICERSLKTSDLCMTTSEGKTFEPELPKRENYSTLLRQVIWGAFPSISLSFSLNNQHPKVELSVQDLPGSLGM